LYRRGTADRAVEAVLFTLRPGTISEPIKTESGFYLVKVISREPGEPLSGHALRDRLRQEMSAETRRKRFEEFLSKLRSAATTGVPVSDGGIESARPELPRQGENGDAADPKHHHSIREQLMLTRRVDREVRRAVMVSETEVRRYFDQHQSIFALPEEYRIRQ